MIRRPHLRWQSQQRGLVSLLVLILPLGWSLLACSALPGGTSPVQEPVPIPRGQRKQPTTPPPPPQQMDPTPAPVPSPVPGPQTSPAGQAKPEEPSAESSQVSLDLLAATLWVQTAEEYRGLALQSYRSAAQRLEAALADPRVSALAGDSPGASSDLPPAVILDIDETVLDNSPFEARLILGKESFSSAAWKEWCWEARAEAIPGALDFVRTATARGVTVFYVTNREAALEDATRNNLLKLGFPAEPAGEDRILSKGEREGWGSEKEPRRRLIAERFRILLLVGDDLGDFVVGARSNLEERRRLTDAYGDRWGREWILLPNPLYGSWERAVLKGADPSEEKSSLEIKRDALRPQTEER